MELIKDSKGNVYTLNFYGEIKEVWNPREVDLFEYDTFKGKSDTFIIGTNATLNSDKPTVGKIFENKIYIGTQSGKIFKIENGNTTGLNRIPVISVDKFQYLENNFTETIVDMVNKYHKSGFDNIMDKLDKYGDEFNEALRLEKVVDSQSRYLESFFNKWLQVTGFVTERSLKTGELELYDTGTAGVFNTLTDERIHKAFVKKAIQLDENRAGIMTNSDYLDVDDGIVKEGKLALEVHNALLNLHLTSYIKDEVFSGNSYIYNNNYVVNGDLSVVIDRAFNSLDINNGNVEFYSERSSSSLPTKVIINGTDVLGIEGDTLKNYLSGSKQTILNARIVDLSSSGLIACYSKDKDITKFYDLKLKEVGKAEGRFEFLPAVKF